MIYAGIDIGSITAKAALIKDNRILGTHVILTGYNPINAGTTVFEALLKKTKISKKFNKKDFVADLQVCIRYRES